VIAKRSRVVVDATPLLYGLAGGTARATKSLVHAISVQASQYEFVFFGRRLLGPTLSSLRLPGPTVHARLPRRAEAAIRRIGLVEWLCGGDLYHATDFYMPLRDPARAIATIYDVIFLSAPEAMVDHRRLAKWVPPFARRARRIITISEYSKREIAEFLDVPTERIDVVYPAADAEAFFPEVDKAMLRRRLSRVLPTDRPYFLAVSCSTGRKNTEMLLQAYASLLEHGPKNDLVLVWNPPAAWRERFSSEVAKDRIHFIGRQGDSALRDLFCGATALVYPSLREGFGLPILEAMSCGTPVISSSSTALPEAGGDAAVYIDPSSQTSLVSALEAFENGSLDIPALREAGIRQAARFSWERTGRETLDVYRKSLEG
jgi:glycosyltransferase involved in cell wall biosynthesis